MPKCGIFRHIFAHFGVVNGVVKMLLCLFYLKLNHFH
nr:MAG TPA: hypothetical protein [Caudoviricetes sp.]